MLLWVSLGVDVLRLHKLPVLRDPYERLELLFTEEWSELSIPQLLLVLFQEGRQHHYKQWNGKQYINDDLNAVPDEGVEGYASQIARGEGHGPGDHAAVGWDEDQTEPEDAPGYVGTKETEHG